MFHMEHKNQVKQLLIEAIATGIGMVSGRPAQYIAPPAVGTLVSSVVAVFIEGPLQELLWAVCGLCLLALLGHLVIAAMAALAAMAYNNRHEGFFYDLYAAIHGKSSRN